MRKNWKRVAATILATVTAASLLAGCGKKTGTTGGEGSSSSADLSETVFVPEYVHLDYKATENDYLDLYNAEIVNGNIFAVANHTDEKEAVLSSFVEFSMETGEKVSEVMVDEGLSDKIDFSEFLPDEFKDVAQKDVGINYAQKLTNGKIAAIVNAYWYVESDNTDEWENGSRSFLALFDEKGNLEKFVSADISDLLKGDNVSVQRLMVLPNDDILIFYTDWGGETSQSAAAVYDSEFNLKNSAILNASQINNVFAAPNGKLYLVYYDDQWNSKTAEFNTDNFSIGTELTGLAEDNINGFGFIEGDPDKMIVIHYSKLMEYDFNEQKTTEIAKWIDMDIKEGSVNMIYKGADGAYYTLISDYESSTYDIAKISEKKRSEVAERKEIVIASYYDDYDLKSAVIEFNKQNSDYHIQVKSYYDWENQDVSPEDALTTMTNDLGGASVPDMVNLENLPVREFVKQGVFADITPFVEASSAIDLSDYNDSITKCFNYDGKLISLPQGFELQTMAVSKKLFGDKEGWSIDEMIDYDLAHPDSVIVNYSMRYYIMQLCLYNNIDYFLNWETGECRFESDEFKKILEYAASFPEELDWEAIDADSTSDAEKLAKGKVLATDVYIYDLESIQEYDDYLFAGEANFIGYPTMDGSPSSLIRPIGSYAICENSQNKDIAWKFIEFMLTQDGDSRSYGLPANKKQLQAMIDEELKHKGTTGGGVSWGDGDTYSYHYATQEEIDEIFRILDMAKLSPGEQNEVFSIIDEETQSYFKGQKAVEECAKIIQSRVSLYVQENM